MHKVTLHNWGKMNLTERTRIREAIATHWYGGKWWAVMVISMLKAATRKRTRKVRSNLHTGQYAGSISPDHRQGQTLVEPLALPGITRHINKFLCKTIQKGLWTCHTHQWSQLPLVVSPNCFGGHYIFGICGLSFCGCKTGLSGTGSLYSGPAQKCPQLLRPTPGSGLCTRGPKSGHPASFHR